MTGQAVAIATEAARSFTGWYDSGQITDWARQLAATVEAIMRVLAQNTDAYMARAISDVAGKRVRPAGRIDVTSLRTGVVTHAGAYGRAADSYRWQQAQFDKFARSLLTETPPGPPDLITPLDAAVNRAGSVADLDMQMTARNQAAKTLSGSRGVITGWRRVIHPELSKGGTCGLCVAASDRIYHVDQLMPIHALCNCVPLPIRDGNDPGSLLNKQDLARLYEQGGSTSGKDLKRTRYKVNEHGELGPVLTDGTFRTSAETKRLVQRRSPSSPAISRDKLRQAYESMLPAMDKANALAGDDPKKWAKYAEQVKARVADMERQLAA